MKTSTFIVAALLLAAATVADAKNQKQVWPDGTPMESWFTDTAKVDVSALAVST